MVDIHVLARVTEPRVLATRMPSRAGRPARLRARLQARLGADDDTLSTARASGS